MTTKKRQYRFRNLLPHEDDTADWSAQDYIEHMDTILDLIENDMISIANQAQEGNYTTIPPGSGILHSHPPQVNIVFDQEACERVQEHGGAYIVQGTDRPTNAASGYGAIGGNAPCSMIDLVVGRMSSQLRHLDPGSMVQNNMVADAARIYICQKTDVDHNFSLADGKIGAQKGKSAIALKADGVRIIGREGVKIVTGGAKAFSTGGRGETNSSDEPLEAAPPIELIAGNNTGDLRFQAGIAPPAAQDLTVRALQPLVKGDNMRGALQELTETIQKILGILLNISVMQTTFNSILGVTVYPGIQPHYAAASTQTANQFISKYINSIYQLRISTEVMQFNYLENPGRRFICSSNVYST